MKIPADVLDVLRTRVETDGNQLVLGGPRLDPRLYQRVNEILEAVGGRWDKAAQAHLFPCDADAALAPVLATGQVVTLREKRKSSQYFPTPGPVVGRLLELAQIAPGMRVLEPSAGSGAIADALRAAGAVVDCVERDPGYAAILAEAGYAVRVGDFLTVPPEPQYARVVMNPPFTRGADMAHVQHALRFLAPGGLLVSVMSRAVTYPGRRTDAFRTLVEQRGGTVEAVPAGAFAASGTDVDTVIVTIPATRPADAAPVAWPVREMPAMEEPEHRDPMEILDELRANLRDAMAEFNALAALLAEPMPAAPQPAEVVELPEPRQEQLALDLNPDAA